MQRRPFGGVTKDPLDLRDLVYAGSLAELPHRIDNRPLVSAVLDQRQEGACTGFALAAVVNFLIRNRRHPPRPRERVSPRMLYELARRYDEWQGQQYEGSSIRGAMKGWHKHGVCREDLWPWTPGEPGRLTLRREKDARLRPLGSYFRVRHLHLNHMHSALRETGILLASSDVHEGWYEVNARTGKVPYRRVLAGGHAFAIVGYDREGFWVQNSWGPGWGLKGFCHIGYDDWLENGYDCWVACLGVPTLSAAMQGRSDRRRVATFDYIPHAEVVQAEIRPHYVSLGNDGRFSPTGQLATDVIEVERIIHEEFTRRVAPWPGSKRLLLWAHGGLNDEKAAVSRIASLLPYFLANEIYPLSFIWHTGLLDSVEGIVADAFRRDHMRGFSAGMWERFRDLLDEAIELGSRFLGRPVWRQIKDNARRASADEAGGARHVSGRLAAHLAGRRDVELHLVGHSAGAVFLCWMVPLLLQGGLRVRSLTLYAPACTTGLFKETILPHAGAGIERLTIFNLSEKAELDDTVGAAYHKSLLYLVSEAFEEQKRTPLLGMQEFYARDRSITRKLGPPAATGPTTVIHSLGGRRNIRLSSRSATHGGFDNDEETLNSTLRIIRGTNTLLKTF